MDDVEAKAVAKLDEVAETTRHNKAMESLEAKKIEYQHKNEQLECGVKLLKQKQELRALGVSPKDIVAMIPDMRKLFKEEELASTFGSEDEEDE